MHNAVRCFGVAAGRPRIAGCCAHSVAVYSVDTSASCTDVIARRARRHLSSRLFNSPHATFNPLYDFLRTLQNNGEPLMIGKRLSDVEAMQKALNAAEKLLLRSDAQVAPRPPRPSAAPQPGSFLLAVRGRSRAAATGASVRLHLTSFAVAALGWERVARLPARPATPLCLA